MQSSTVLVAILTSTVIAACGHDSGVSIDATPPDVSDPDVPPDPPTTITVNTDGPALIAYRDGAGPWTTPPGNGPGVFELAVHGPYIVTVVCDDGTGDIFMTQLAQTLDDDHDVFLFCGSGSDTSLAVTGHMVQAGQVALGFSGADSPTPAWDFQLDATPGSNDLVAVSVDRIAIRHDLAITAPTALPPVDVAVEGLPLLPATLGATNAKPGETVRSTIRLTTKNFTFARVSSGTGPVKVAPDGALVVGDQQRATVAASVGNSDRSAQRRSFHAGDNGQFTLPDALGAVVFADTGGKLALTWSTLPAQDFLDANVDSFSDDFSTFTFHDLQISASYVTQTTATSATVDTDIPGFKPEWKIDFTKAYDRAFSAFQFKPSEILTSSVFESLNQPPALVRRHHRLAGPIARRSR